jgi:hypothetical protein
MSLDGRRVPAAATGRRSAPPAQPRASRNARIWLQLHSRDPKVRERAWKKYFRTRQKASAAGSPRRDRKRAAAAAAFTPAAAEEQLDYEDDLMADAPEEEYEDDYHPSEVGALGEDAPDHYEQEEPADEPAGGEPAAAPIGGGEASPRQTSHHLTRGEELAAEYDALSSLHAQGHLSLESFYAASRPLLESAVEHFRLGIGEFPATLGLDPVVVRTFWWPPMRCIPDRGQRTVPSTKSVRGYCDLQHAFPGVLR